MATVLFNNRTTDGESAEHTIAVDRTTIVATGTNWERSRLIGLLETTAGSGVFQSTSFEMTGPGQRDFLANGAAGQKLKLLLLGTSLTSTVPKIGADAN